VNRLTPEKRVDTILNIDKLKSIVGPVGFYKQRLEEIIIQLGDNFKKTDPEIIKEQLEKTVVQSKTRTQVNDQWEKLLKP